MHNFLEKLTSHCACCKYFGDPCVNIDVVVVVNSLLVYREYKASKQVSVLL